MTNCPNCGAPVTSWKCEYCDTVFEKPDTVYGYVKNTKLVNLEKQRLELKNALLEQKIKILYEQKNLYSRLKGESL